MLLKTRAKSITDSIVIDSLSSPEKQFSKGCDNV
jgi:hypothetical protein